MVGGVIVTCGKAHVLNSSLNSDISEIVRLVYLILTAWLVPPTSDYQEFSGSIGVIRAKE